MKNANIGLGTQVTMHFAIKLEDGQVVDSNFGAKPVQFEFGDGNLPEGFEAALTGLTEGDHVTLTISPERGFGQHNSSNIQMMNRDSFKHLELETGLVVSFQEPGGEIPGIVTKFDETQVWVDFNHPLAGKTLLFEVHILSVVSKQNTSL